ncbi:four-helix bundle copper-binding protein [Allosalinactinospora lopnorensis]|uniref:four-helix bundle copper-binding protein n=1 Tax=Allosalinactinospora lopnorensis TaxID=1352348 RepID=UPI000623D81D|nr:four-helix bundle copper-binding protein [Allosalinactinospora lopnorensis]
MPIGYPVTVLLVAGCAFFALAPLRGPRPLDVVSFRFGLLLNERPFVAFYWLLASTLLVLGQGDLDSSGGWTGFGVAALTTLGLGAVARRGCGRGRRSNTHWTRAWGGVAHRRVCAEACRRCEQACRDMIATLRPHADPARRRGRSGYFRSPTRGLLSSPARRQWPTASFRWDRLL